MKRANLLLLGVSVVLSLAAAEGGLRLLGFSTYKSLDVIYEPSERLGFRLAEEHNGTICTAEACANVWIHEHTRVLPDLQPLKVAEPIQVHAIGDSFCFGQSVDDQDVWLNQLTRGYRGQPVHFVNHGVPNYSSNEYHVVAESLPQDLSRAIVVYLFFPGNDFTGRTDAQFKAQLTAPQITSHRWLTSLVASKSALVWAVTATFLNHVRQAGGTSVLASREDLSDFLVSPTWSTTTQLVASTVDLLRARGAQVIFVTLPYGKYYIDGDSDGPAILVALSDALIDDLTRRHPWVASTNFSRQVTSPENLFIKSWGHLTVHGNQVLARAVEDKLQALVKAKVEALGS